MDIVGKVKRMREIGDEYETLLNDVLNALFKVIPNCVALNMDDSLMPVYAISALKTQGLLAFPYNCGGKPGYVVIKEDGTVVFEDMEGHTQEMGRLA
ncbi:hypothetical protein L3N51_02412 [Metallosphaera sp. J1]|uniref:hypothetical protein n=1 Tax=Metallosphaera javensis (ex Hofmann et al. 2022) TaxID=99938 RepID=UPI0029FF293C|nr:hypothetical protein [Metallosphaera javensis (ex Hofmann et al. 2022)]MCG3110115.1 hypothetical protein [Metallosphaera javensis (ex Hofmann et al. 2022)]